MEEVLASAALVAAGLALLCFGGNWLVGGGENIARRLRISSFVIGMTVVAYGTSTPELAASIAAAGQHSAIILGNVVGSNIANIGMVIGVSAILLPLAIGRSVLRREIPIMIGVSALLVVLSIDGAISPYDGLVLLGGLGIVTFRTVRIIAGQRAEGAASGTAAAAESGADDSSSSSSAASESILRQSGGRFYAKNVGMLGAGIGLLYAGAILTVDHAVILAETFGLSQKVIGLTVVAIGTSLPELITSMMAIRRGRHDIGVGNIIGSNIYNVLMIMGVGAVLGGVSISQDVYLDYGIMLAFGASLFVALKANIIGRSVGICLVAGYVAYLGMSLLK
ncbi:MAG: calcium/sodium antiporter [Nitrosopumilaceae archaeon]|nr:calcium/sodium antiporter [Nitrosopumilaceae archaeon]